MFEGIIISAVFMVFEIFFLLKWLQNKENKKKQIAWGPFRKLMLDSIIHHADELAVIAGIYVNSIKTDLREIKERGNLDQTYKNKLERTIEETIKQLNKSQNKFFNILQTVAPALKPYVADYCNDVLWFHNSIEKSLSTARYSLATLTTEELKNSDKVSDALINVYGSVFGVQTFYEFRFAEFKKEFTQSVWKIEEFHYYKNNNEFLSKDDFAKSLSSDKDKLKLKNIPESEPAKSFFDPSITIH